MHHFSQKLIYSGKAFMHQSLARKIAVHKNTPTCKADVLMI